MNTIDDTYKELTRVPFSNLHQKYIKFVITDWSVEDRIVFFLQNGWRLKEYVEECRKRSLQFYE